MEYTHSYNEMTFGGLCHWYMTTFEKAGWIVLSLVHGNTEKVQFYVPRYEKMYDQLENESGKELLMKASSQSRGFRRSSSVRSPRGGSAVQGAPVAIMTAKVEQKSASATSVVFKIGRKTTIKQDNEPHKVAITIIELKEGAFKYTIHPNQSQRAYLRAKVKNTSLFPLLPGKTKIFFGNNFNCTTEIAKAASPQEQFSLNLGTDPGVQVVYKPVHKYLEETGVINKSSVETFSYETRIRNSKHITIYVKVRDQLPLSTTDQIKVKLLVPDVKNDAVELQKDNNLKWKLPITAGTEIKIPLKYTIEHLRDKEIEIR